uniref:Uncharacterized protein n=1 Tax=Lactuca sativa TaxID=4236 RepID=A0A9R1XCZ6_LACSA|nr:hypothetical protein LSAT_V11C500270550 [Lactuca sativa]
MHTIHSGRSSPLEFDPKIERTDRSNRVARRNINTMSVDNVVVEDVVEGHEDEVNNPPPLIPPPAPQFPNNINGNNGDINNFGAPIIQPVQPHPNRNHRGQNGNVGNHNGGNVRNHNQNPRNAGPQFSNGGNASNEDDWNFDDGSDNGIGWNQNHNGGNRRNQGIQGGNENYNNWNNQNFHNCGNNDYNDGFGNQGFGNQYRRNPNGGFNNANGGYYNEGNQFPHLYFPQPNRQSVASHFHLGEYDDASPILFMEGNEHHVEFYPASTTTKIRKAVQYFAQKPNEEFHDAFERLKELLRSCPHHEFPRWQLVCFFYDGVDTANQTIINASSGGTIMMQDSEDA